MKNKNRSGQTLVVLLVFIAMAMIIISASVVMMAVNSLGATRFDRGQVALDAAESGAENALMTLLRNPSYSGETISIGESSVLITVPGGNFPKNITSKATLGNTIRTIQVSVSYTNNVLTVVSWKEI